MQRNLLVSAEVSRAIDAEAAREWGFDEFALVEAAGRGAAMCFEEAFPRFFKDASIKIAAAAGRGNNGADALVMIRYWLLSGKLSFYSALVVVSRDLGTSANKNPCGGLLSSLKKMNVEIIEWDSPEGKAASALAGADLIIDGIAGTGVRGPLVSGPAEMTLTVAGFAERKKNPEINDEAEMAGRQKVPFIVSVDMPSGIFEGWKPGMPAVKADVTLAIEPQKHYLYNPASRPLAGKIIPVGAVFPYALIAGKEDAELFDWERAKKLLPPIEPDAYKHERGSVEIRAGAPGTLGAAVIAARGAQAAGAGLVRLVCDDGIYLAAAQSLGASFPGIMTAPLSVNENSSVFLPDAFLLGPGWGKTEDRKVFFEKALEREKAGAALVLDADAIPLAKNISFNERAILTPHPGEFAALTGASMDEVLFDPLPLLLKTAREKKAVIILKGHVINVVSSSGKRAVIDGMVPALASGGSGDLLAGFCAALAARMARKSASKKEAFSGAWAAAVCASALLISSGKLSGGETGGTENKDCLRFTDPFEIAEMASRLAGRAWLGGVYE